MDSSTSTPLPPLDLQGSSAVVAERWKRWRRAFEYYCDAKGISTSAKKKSTLLHLLGMDVQDLFEDLADPGPVPANDDGFKEAMRKLDGHFKAELNVPYERHVFRQMVPQSGESIDQFVVRLRRQARQCTFEDTVDSQIRDQIVEKISPAELQKKLLEVTNISLDRALEICRAWEVAGSQVSEMAGGSFAAADVNAVTHRRSTVTCFSCGLKGHMARDVSCPAKGKKCRLCDKTGHFAKCCKSKQPNKSKNKQTNQVGDPVPEPGVEVQPLDASLQFGINNVHTAGVSEKLKPIFVHVLVDGQALRMEVDTGAMVSLIPENVWEG